ncbi:MAG: LLM class flavin-dependent oxidoreductase [SAR202 cluster bacterium]|nr:LLM class flavin-dependent oxidoreductase [SAR202 cluster bacterium]
MHFGIFDQLPCAESQSPAQRYHDLVSQATLADKLGFQTVWLAELHFNPRFSVMPSPLLAASAIAQATQRIRVGTAVNLVPLHHPIRLAEEVATLDLLSGGRAVFGIGRGSNPSHYEGYGIPMSEGRDRFQEALDFVLQAWATDSLDFQGRYYQAHGLQVTPKPCQQPHPPVYVAANSADTFPLVGDLGHSILTTPLIIGNKGVQDGLSIYRQHLAEGGHDPAAVNVVVTLPCYVASDRKKARAGLEPTINNYLETLRLTSRGRGADRAMQLNYDEIYSDLSIIGDPSECVERLHQLRERFGCQEFMGWFNIGGMLPNAEVARSLRLFAEKVMPQF